MPTFGKGLFKTMGIAYKNLFRKKITVQYPHERLEIPDRARWMLAHKFYDDGEPKCTACLMCEKACPMHVINITTEKKPDGKFIDSYHYETNACMFCGLCVEACPFDAIHMSHDYELASAEVTELRVNLLQDVYAADPKKRAAKEKAKKEGADDKGVASKNSVDKDVTSKKSGDKDVATKTSADKGAPDKGATDKKPVDKKPASDTTLADKQPADKASVAQNTGDTDTASKKKASGLIIDYKESNPNKTSDSKDSSAGVKDAEVNSTAVKGAGAKASSSTLVIDYKEPNPNKAPAQSDDSKTTISHSEDVAQPEHEGQLDSNIQGGQAMTQQTVVQLEAFEPYVAPPAEHKPKQALTTGYIPTQFFADLPDQIETHKKGGE